MSNFGFLHIPSVQAIVVSNIAILLPIRRSQKGTLRNDVVHSLRTYDKKCHHRNGVRR